MAGTVVVITEIVKTFVLCVASFQVILWSIRQGSLGVSDLKLASSSPPWLTLPAPSFWVCKTTRKLDDDEPDRIKELENYLRNWPILQAMDTSSVAFIESNDVA